MNRFPRPASPTCDRPALKLADLPDLDQADVPTCPECGNTCFVFDDPDTGPEPVCLDCVAFTIASR